MITELVWVRVIKKHPRFWRGFRLSISLCVFIGDAARSGPKISCGDTRFRIYAAGDLEYTRHLQKREHGRLMVGDTGVKTFCPTGTFACGFMCMHMCRRPLFPRVCHASALAGCHLKSGGQHPYSASPPRFGGDSSRYITIHSLSTHTSCRRSLSGLTPRVWIRSLSVA